MGDNGERNIIISVIVPVYNGEKYIQRVVESLLGQQTDLIEIILVDDGSTDGSGILCDTYAEKNDRICVVHKQNSGISSARNAGLVVAQGEYISFVDVDDFMDQNAYTKLIDIITKHKPDCIDFGWKYVSRFGDIGENHHKLPKNKLLLREEIEKNILPPLLNLCKDDDHFIYDFSCTKVYRRDIVESNHVKFDETRRIWEDRPFVVEYLKYCRSFYSVDKCFYNYCDIPGSLSRQYNLKFFDIILSNYRFYRSLYDDRYDFDTDYVNGYWAQAIENMIFRSLEQTENGDAIRENIISALTNQQVIHWFSKRKTHTKAEIEIGVLITSGQAETALEYYRKEYEIRKHKNAPSLFQKGKKAIYGLLRGLQGRDEAPNS